MTKISNFYLLLIFLTSIGANWSCSSESQSNETHSPTDQRGAGLFYTTEELEIWNNRRLNGPYKENWDNRIFAGAQTFLNEERDANPWDGYTGEGCWSPSTNVHPSDNNRPRGTWANQAGFVYRVLEYAGDPNASIYFNKVKSYLLAHPNVPGIDFENSDKWCPSSYSIQGHQHWIGAWMRRLAVTYSWIKEDMSDAEKSEFENWLLAAGRYIVKHNEWHIGSSFSNRYNDEYICDGTNCPGQKTQDNLYQGGPPYFQVHSLWNNRGSAVASAVAIIGIITKNDELRDKGKRFFKESLKYSVWPDGTYVDIHRDGPGAANAWAYPMSYMGSMSAVADALARSGDVSLYEYSTKDGIEGTESNTEQPAKSIDRVINHLAGQVDGTIIKYGTGETQQVINTTNTAYGGVDTSEYFFIQSNLFYKSNYIKAIYTRTAPGAPEVTTTEPSGFDRHTGDWGTYPDVEFMWADLEGKVWPYGGSR